MRVAMLKILLSMGFVLSANACASSSLKGECPAVESVKTIPFKDGTGYDSSPSRSAIPAKRRDGRSSGWACHVEKSRTPRC